MIVLDASAAVEWLLQTTIGQRIEQRLFVSGESLHSPHLLDLEVLQVLRRLLRTGTISTHRADEAVNDLAALRITRHAGFVLMSRIWELRDNLSAYDAAYVALAEVLGAVLVTRDSKLASAAGHAASVEVF
jgi:predicted nucleic acid-binding protein